jgi:hypothetical protein
MRARAQFSVSLWKTKHHFPICFGR